MFIRRKLKICLQFLGLLVVLFFLSILARHGQPPKAKAKYPVGPLQGANPFITTFPHPHRNTIEARVQQNVKTILLWTEFFSSKNWGTSSLTFPSCAVKTCRVTMNKSNLNHADAVLINTRDIFSSSDLPHVHPPNQVWIAHDSEPPYYIYLDLGSFNNVFNWTSWYRSDADIFSPYNHYAFLKPGETKEPNGFRHNFIDDPNHVQDQVDDPFALHDLMVFWAASSCINYSQRYKLVANLQKYLPVHLYGNCGTLTCDKGSKSCAKLMKRYKFVLALENGYCRDYITEKYWNALHRHQIPIVGGGADYSKLAIPGSYIDADNFTSVEELARFIQRVGSDRHLYNSFFAWRSRYRELSYGVSNWCQICAELHNSSRVPQVYSDFKGWVVEDTCPLHNGFQSWLWEKQYVLFKLFGI